MTMGEYVNKFSEQQAKTKSFSLCKNALNYSKKANILPSKTIMSQLFLTVNLC